MTKIHWNLLAEQIFSPRAVSAAMETARIGRITRRYRAVLARQALSSGRLAVRPCRFRSPAQKGSFTSRNAAFGSGHWSSPSLYAGVDIDSFHSARFAGLAFEWTAFVAGAQQVFQPTPEAGGCSGCVPARCYRCLAFLLAYFRSRSAFRAALSSAARDFRSFCTLSRSTLSAASVAS